jgi:predicted transposase YbfD/YdcC
MKSTIEQWPIGPVNNGETDPEKIKFTGEITNLWPFVMWLREQYGELTENFTVDAGPWSRELFARFDAAGFGLFGNLKENKPELFAEAERVLRIAMAAVNRTRRRTGKRPAKARSNANFGGRPNRTDGTAGATGWVPRPAHWQVAVVKQTTRRDGEPDVVELRYFATNVTTGMMAPQQLLALVRLHWAIENDCNWTFDMVLHEDDGAWCTQGKGALALGVVAGSLAQPIG